MRLIDADALFPNGVFIVNADYPTKSLDELLHRIWNAPTIEAEPVKHGKWIKSKDDWFSLDFIQCSLCHEEWCIEVEEGVVTTSYKYCPNCGAKMDLEE